MAIAKGRTRTRRRVSLTVRLSLLVLFAALLPLAAVVGINDYFSRGTLIDQSRQALTTDASSKVSLIDTYLHERELDGSALASLPTAPAYIACSSPQELPAALSAALAPALDCSGLEGTGRSLAYYKDSNRRALSVGLVRGIYHPQKGVTIYTYPVWSLYDGTGKQLLTESAPGVAANAIPTMASPDELAQVMRQGKQTISAVYYDPASHHAYVHILSPITLASLGAPLPASVANTAVGFLDATLNLDYIWDQVKTDLGANGAGSYAFVTDENGVRIADAQGENLFTAVAPLSASAQQAISSTKRYGDSGPVTVNSLPGVASSLQSTNTSSSFQGIAQPGSSEQYQFVRVRMASANWTYFVLSPLSTVTQVADEQIRVSLLIAAVIAVLAILLGLFIGTRTTRPVLNSTSDLEGAAVALKLLASRQESSASEQQWVVDACRTGLESVRYLSDAMNQAARRIIDASNWFSEYWDRLTEEQAKRTVSHLLELARYIDEAARRQQASSDRLDKAITVTIQVSEQLVSGASAASTSAEQLEQVVQNLQQVVGGKHQPTAEQADAQGERNGGSGSTSMALMPNEDVYRGGRSGRIGGQAAPQMQRQIAGPASNGSEMWGAPQSPFTVAGGRRQGDSQAYPGTSNDYDSYGSYGQPNQGVGVRQSMPGNRPSRFWEDR